MGVFLGKKIKDKYTVIEELNNSLFVIQDDELNCGLYSRILDKSTELVYNMILEKRGEFIIADKNEGIEILNSSCELLVDGLYDNYEILYNSDKYILLVKGDRKGILKDDGSWLLEPKYTSIEVGEDNIKAQSEDDSRVTLSSKVFL